ncbi:MAG: hypothetical protein JNJ85_06530 [Candidatus Kapabacteria bacterium]|nr:hypothetical protein [Candidatus Kapabacteria bacterium]
MIKSVPITPLPGRDKKDSTSIAPFFFSVWIFVCYRNPHRALQQLMAFVYAGKTVSATKSVYRDWRLLPALRACAMCNGLVRSRDSK